jgi:hypothetical protein
MTFCGEVSPKDTWVDTIRIQVGYESLDVTLAYLKGSRTPNRKKRRNMQHSSSLLV